MRLLAAAVVALLAACSGTTPYRQAGENNLEVRSSLQGARASLHIHRLDEQCRTHYEGTVALDQPVIGVAVPFASVLVVSFDTSSFLGGSRGTRREFALAPRTGYRYRLEVRYKDDIYDVALSELSSRDGRAAALPLSPAPCPPSR